MLTMGLPIRAAANQTVLIGEEDLIPGSVCNRANIHAKRPAVQRILPGNRLGRVRDLLGAAFHVFAVFADHILPADADEGQGDQQKADGDQRGNGNKVAQIDAFHPFSPVSSSNL